MIRKRLDLEARGKQDPESEEVVREQFIRKDSHHHVADVISESVTDNEVELQEADRVSEAEADEINDEESGYGMPNPAEEEVPQCVRILQNAMIRSRLHNLDYLGFTEGEMRLLTADPLFAQLQPQMAADMKQALLEHDSG